MVERISSNTVRIPFWPKNFAILATSCSSESPVPDQAHTWILTEGRDATGGTGADSTDELKVNGSLPRAG